MDPVAVRLDEVEIKINQMRRLLETFDYVKLTQRMRNLEQTVDSIADAVPSLFPVVTESLEPNIQEDDTQETADILETTVGRTGEEGLGTPESIHEVPLSPTAPNAMINVDNMIGLCSKL